MDKEFTKINKVSAIKSDNKFEESFKFILPGYNLRPLEISAAVGIEQLLKLLKLLEARRKNANLMKKIISKSKIFKMQKELGESSWFGFAIIIREDSDIQEKNF